MSLFSKSVSERKKENHSNHFGDGCPFGPLFNPSPPLDIDNSAVPSLGPKDLFDSSGESPTAPTASNYAEFLTCAVRK